MTDWVEETLYPDFRLKLRVERVLYEGRSDSHHLQIIENPIFGRVLYLSGVLQTTEKDEFIYHEMLAHVPILAHGRAQSVLIIGGGDGGMLEEALKHRTVERVTMVEIDPSVVDLAKSQLRSICRDAFDDPRLVLVFADGCEFVRHTDRRYDVVIIDSTDPIGPGEVLFTERFYRDCRRTLNPGGVLVTQNGVPFMQGGELSGSIALLGGIFADASCYLATVPTYVGGPMAFGFASDDTLLRRVPLETLRARYASARIATGYYNPEVHRAAFALPGYVRRLIG
ncbi:MAG: polyamine aminopropyltransferase [Geminicoccaceae bacterium]